ncbi:MAG TPA: 3-deoxy-manno-octulosonate cytidylyltransferase [Thermodesulfobacteriota bacterium]|nr:3-deoxy-manno-octulosonate cytidylyltransferase [Thermodesulfobacteriota bacterium]
MKVIGIIPARFGSTRLPGKILADIGGKPMIRHVYERARRSAALDRLVVATDDDRIYDCVHSFGGEAVRTSPLHPSGTDRAAEAAQALKAAASDVIVNIQGDQPLFEPGMVDEIVAPFRGDPGLVMGALVYPIRDREELMTPSVVKVVTDRQGFALYFSRSPMPYVIADAPPPRYFKHIGPYAYRMDFLVRFTRMERGELEKAESLEQLRALENGFRIRIIETRYDSQEVDTPEDLEKVRSGVSKGASPGVHSL